VVCFGQAMTVVQCAVSKRYSGRHPTPTTWAHVPLRVSPAGLQTCVAKWLVISILRRFPPVIEGKQLVEFAYPAAPWRSAQGTG